MVWIFQPASPRNCLQCARRHAVIWFRAGLQPEVICDQKGGIPHEVLLDEPCFREENFARVPSKT